ncbi:MAG: OmpH family outer membrane protein [Candidatus Zixiibacteriota bacterium]
MRRQRVPGWVLRRCLPAVTVMVALTGARPALAQVHVGTVDVERVRKDSPAFKSALKEIDDMVADFEKRRDRKRAELDSLSQELQEATDRNLSATVDRYRRALTEKSREFGTFMDETFGTNGIIETHSSELMTPLYQKLAEAAKVVAQAQKLDLILDLEQINPLFTSDQLDVTDAVLVELAKLR